jgi:hypothetical protein
MMEIHGQMNSRRTDGLSYPPLNSRKFKGWVDKQKATHMVSDGVEILKGSVLTSEVVNAIHHMVGQEGGQLD